MYVKGQIFLADLSLSVGAKISGRPASILLGAEVILSDFMHLEI